MAKWRFETLGPHDPEIDNQNRKLFEGDETAFVRETIQNAMDASDPSPDSDDPVKVRFTLASTPRDKLSKYLKELIPHTNACNPAIQKNTEEMSYLLVEDEGTIGLRGSLSRDQLDPAEANTLFNFWMRDGKSQKTGSKEVGGHGVGKAMLYHGSQLRTVFGYSITKGKDGSKVHGFMGRFSDKTHSYENKMWQSYAFFCEEDAENRYHTITDQSQLETFRTTFGLRRSMERTGTSLVLLSPAAYISAEKIIKAVLIHYSFPIMMNKLDVEVRDLKKDIFKDIGEQNLLNIAMELDWKDTDWKNQDDNRSVKSRIEFLESIATTPDNDPSRINLPDGITEITEQSFGEQLQQAKTTLNNGGTNLSIKVPINIKRADGIQEPGAHVDVYLHKNADLDRGEDTHVRNGIFVAKEGGRLKNYSVWALLWAKPGPAAEFLGAAEPPGHDRWQYGVLNDTGKYETKSAAPTLRFVKGCMLQIVRVLWESETAQRSANMFADIFYLPTPAERTGRQGPPRTVGDHRSSPNLFNVSTIPAVQGEVSGFSVKLSPEGKQDLPMTATIRVAYDILGGDPFSKHNPIDFSFKSNVNPIVQGVEFMEVNDNKLVLSIVNEDFSLTLKGFDAKRDIKWDIQKV